MGVEELDQDKLTPLLRLKYHNSIADAVAVLGRPEGIGKAFAGFQQYLDKQGLRAARPHYPPLAWPLSQVPTPNKQSATPMPSDIPR